MYLTFLYNTYICMYMTFYIETIETNKSHYNIEYKNITVCGRAKLKLMTVVNRETYIMIVMTELQYM